MRIILGAFLLLFSLNASAGIVRIQDSLGILKPSDGTAVMEKVGSWPFDMRILISDQSRSKGEFEEQISRQVIHSKIVAIGISPKHHFTVVRFDTSLNVDPHEIDNISRAGNKAFAAGEFGTGIIAIGDKVKSSMLQVPVSVRVEQPISDLWFVVPIGLLSALVLFVLIGMRNRRKERERQARLNSLRIADEITKQDDEILQKERQRDLLRPIEVPSLRKIYTTYEPAIQPVTFQTTTQRTVQPIVVPQVVAPIVTPVVNQPSMTSNLVSGGLGFAAGMAVDELLHHHSEPEKIIEREVIKEVHHESHYEKPIDTGSSSSWAEEKENIGSSSSWSSSEDNSSGSSSSYSSISDTSSRDSGSSSSWSDDSSSSSDSGSSSGGSSDW